VAAEFLDLDALRRTGIAHDPYDHVVLPGFVPAEDAAAARAVFPQSASGGIEPAGSRSPDDALGRLLAALRDPATSAAFSDVFGVPLSPDTLMIHLRSRCRPQDGRIHTDSRDKLVTGLIYLNETWPHPGGRLRVLRSADNLEDMAGEVLPIDGTLVAFRRSDASFHGHHPHDGVRLYIMFNWMVTAAAARRETRRHAVSSVFKRLVGAA
jgi:SM-20-related protein